MTPYTLTHPSPHTLGLTSAKCDALRLGLTSAQRDALHPNPPLVTVSGDGTKCFNPIQSSFKQGLARYRALACRQLQQRKCHQPCPREVQNRKLLSKY